jgi:hypothetical protein
MSIGKSAIERRKFGFEISTTKSSGVFRAVPRHVVGMILCLTINLQVNCYT